MLNVTEFNPIDVLWPYEINDSFTAADYWFKQQPSKRSRRDGLSNERHWRFYRRVPQTVEGIEREIFVEYMVEDFDL